MNVYLAIAALLVISFAVSYGVFVDLRRRRHWAVEYPKFYCRSRFAKRFGHRLRLRRGLSEDYCHRVYSVDWRKHTKEDCSALEVPHLILTVSQQRDSANEFAALCTHMCYGGECLSPVSLDIYPFVVELISVADGELLSDLLHYMFEPVAYCCNSSHPLHHGKKKLKPFESEIFDLMQKDKHRFELLLNHGTKDISEGATAVIESLTINRDNDTSCE